MSNNQKQITEAKAARKSGRSDLRQFDGLCTIPEELGVTTEAEYLEYLVWKGAKKRYGESLTDMQRERITMELQSINNDGYASYFLFIRDIVRAAREELGAYVGPGRSNSGGSIVAYCLYITDVDPMKHGLLFERFFYYNRADNPRIDLDFDVEGRERVIEWLKKKYGESRVANVVTYDIQDGKRIITGINRFLFVVASQDICNLAPVCEVDDKYSGKRVLATKSDINELRKAGIKRMDLMGLKALSAIKECLPRINASSGEKLDLNRISLDDEATLKLYSEGDTIGVFLFESEGMQEYLRILRTPTFNDLAALNALHHPLGMNKIDHFTDRKQGRETIVYHLPEMESVLGDTYGITVYQEQLMQLSQLLAGFTPWESAILYRGFVRRNEEVIDWLAVQFFMGGQKKGYPKEILEKIWDEWKTDATKLFNKSHSVCYTLLSYQTAYLKAHYREEYMSTLISQAAGDERRIQELTNAK